MTGNSGPYGANAKVCDNTRRMARALTIALSHERDEEVRLHVQALRDLLVQQIADADAKDREANR